MKIYTLREDTFEYKAGTVFHESDISKDLYVEQNSQRLYRKEQIEDNEEWFRLPT